MNNTNDPRPLQRLVPADERGDERACAEALNSPIPADEQTGSPAPVESPSEVEARVADLERRVDDSYRQWHAAWKALAAAKTEERSMRIAHVEWSRLLEAEQSATGGNSVLNEQEARNGG